MHESKVDVLNPSYRAPEFARPVSIWRADNKECDKRSDMERILSLVPLDALAAASKTVDAKLVHSSHAYFLRAGDLDIPIMYQVQRVRDGKTFATRRIEAIQKGKVLFTLLASFQKYEEGFKHQVETMPSVPNPEELLSMEELRERSLTDPRLPRTYWKKTAGAKLVPLPIEIRFCEPTSQTKSFPSLRYWFRARGLLSDDQALHRCIAAYASDLLFLQISLNPHLDEGREASAISLDHSIRFHRSFRADDWILFVINSPNAHNARGCVSGRMFTRKGELVVSLTQEGLLRWASPPVSPVKSKL